MKKAVVAIIIFSMILMLVGCGDDSVPVNTIKQEIVVACGKDNTGTLGDIMQEFTATSETTQVKLLEFSNESVELHRVISSMLAGKEIQLDAMLIEDVWVGEFVKDNRLLSLGDKSDFKSDSYPKGIESFVANKENLYWYPIILDMGIMYYREDLTDGGVTLEDLAGGDKGAYTLQGADGEEMLCCALEFVNLAGSVEKGLKIYRQAIENSVSESGNYLTDFKDGKAMYMRSWSSESRDIINGYSSVRGVVGTEMMKNASGDGYATARAYGFAVNKETKSAENCRELLEYLKTDAVQIGISKGMGTLPLKREYYEDPMTVDTADYMVSAGKLFDSFRFRPAREDYTFASREARVALNDYLTNNGSVDAAAKAVANLIGQ